MYKNQRQSRENRTEHRRMDAIFQICVIFVIAICDSCHSSCGKREGFSGNVGGESVKKGEWPWLAAFVEVYGGNFFCGGSLISKRHIMSGMLLEKLYSMT